MIDCQRCYGLKSVISRDYLDDGLAFVLEQKAQTKIEFAGFEGPFFSQPSWGISVLSPKCMNGEQRIPANC